MGGKDTSLQGDPPALSIDDAVLECLRTTGELSDLSIAADLSGLVAYGTLEIIGWTKERPCPELTARRAPAVLEALKRLENIGRVAKVQGSVTRWEWRAEKKEAVQVQGGLF